MKASAPAKGSGKRTSGGKAVSKPAPKAKKAAPAKQATATRRVATPRPKPKTVAKPVAKRAARPAASARTSAKATTARRSLGGRAQPKSAGAKRPAAKPVAAARKPAAKPASSSAKRPSPAKAPKPQARREKQAPRAAAKAKVPVAAKPAAKHPAGKSLASAKPESRIAQPMPSAAPKPVSKPPTSAASSKPKPPPRSEAGSSAEAPVRVAAPLATIVRPLPHPAPPSAVEVRPPAPVRPVAPPMGGQGLARALPDTHFMVRREAQDALSIQPPQPSAMPVEFKSGDHVVYPTHGVGTVQGIETMSAAGYALQVIVVTFDENRMTLRVPVGKALSSGLRKLASSESMTEALDTLRGRARVKRTMWSRRAQEYEAKINSGDPVQIAEVVRDLHRNAGQPDQSFSERQIYEQALDRLAAELAAIDRTDKPAATEKLLQHLNAA
jgi:CarD family transcriptional regulator